MEQPFIAVCELLQNYFDGLYYADTERLSHVFHPNAHYVCATDNETLLLCLPEYLSVVAKRVAPASKGEQRHDAILSIDFAGPNTAIAKVTCVLAPKHFVDLLSLIKTQGQWQIISKNFHYSMINSDK